MLRFPGLRQLLVGYLARIWIEVLPQHEYVWQRGQALPIPLIHCNPPRPFLAGAGN